MQEQTYQMKLKPVEPKGADDKQKPLLERAKKESGMIPNMYKHMVNLPGLQDTYDTGYAHFRKDSGFSSVEQEVILLTLSKENNCHYCIAAHSYLADEVSGVPGEVTDALREDQEIPDEKLRALADFTRVMFRSRGNPSPEEAEAFFKGGYSEKHLLGIILAIAVKTMSNYSNHLFRTPIDPIFKNRKTTE